MDESLTAFSVVEPPRRSVGDFQARQGGHEEHTSHASVVAFRAVQVAVDPALSRGTGTRPA